MTTIRTAAWVAISFSIACSDAPDASPGTAQPETVPAAVVSPSLPPAPPPEASADTEQAPRQTGERQPGEALPPPSEETEAPGPKARQLQGSYRFVGGQRERRQVGAAIEKVTDEMNFLVRRIAKRRLMGSNNVPSRLTIERDGDHITVSFDERKYTAKIGAAPVTVIGSNGEPTKLTHRMQGDRLVQRFRGEDGSRTNLFSVDEGGKLRMKATIAARQLPSDVVYTLTFQR